MKLDQETRIDRASDDAVAPEPNLSPQTRAAPGRHDCLENSEVRESRAYYHADVGQTTKRRRHCKICGRRWSTLELEAADAQRLTAVLNDIDRLRHLIEPMRSFLRRYEDTFAAFSRVEREIGHARRK